MKNFDNVSFKSGNTELTQKTNVNQQRERGEQVKVIIRVRPMNQNELNRGDDNCVQISNQNQVTINSKTIQKSYKFNEALADYTSQLEVFNICQISSLLDSVLDGYSGTVFAYGQTGSGKTYTMSGVEEKLARDTYIPDETEGIIPRAIRYIWNAMAKRQEQYFVKATFTEIYLEQIRDLLNPASGILHDRWNIQNGFFVEDLMVVECTSIDDLIAVLHQGVKNRKKGEHNLNRDSSRSHSILTIYLISQAQQQQLQNQKQDELMKKYGKISFVDLAGSERLKESKSQGEMVKETQQINKSLFTLGKVIKLLSDKKVKSNHIPYRDSKLTKLLMDSLGGSTKSIMIACITPSLQSFDESLNTMQYAARTMNITNTPIVQMDGKDQLINTLDNQLHILKMENQYLRQQLQRIQSGLPPEIQEFVQGRNSKILPPLLTNKSQQNFKNPPKTAQSQQSDNDISINKIISEFDIEVNRLRQENEELLNNKDGAEANYQNVMKDNAMLQTKLENLETVFIGNPMQKGNNISQPMGDEYMTSVLLQENTELKHKNQQLIQKTKQLQKTVTYNIKDGDIANLEKLVKGKQVNKDLQQKFEYLQSRERDLLNQIKIKKN